MATKQSSKAKKATKNRKRIPSVQRLEGVHSLKMKPMTLIDACHTL